MNGEAIPLLTIFGSLLFAGLAGSMHCVGMCGPILAGFTQLFRGEGDEESSLALDFACYHAGRIWTYALLGFAAGSLGQGVRNGAELIGLQRWAGLVGGLAVIATGLMLSGWLPAIRLKPLAAGCALPLLGGRPLLMRLVASRGLTARLLLGVVMGFLPCGLVYGMLVPVAVLPHPGLSAAGMVVFGIGTIPALGAVLVTARVIPIRLRRYSTRFAAVAIMLSGLWMVVRSLAIEPGQDGCVACEQAEPASVESVGDR